MKIILTVTGLDHVGIIATVTTRLAELDVNVENLSQTLMGGYFTMILQGSFDETQRNIEQIQEALAPAAEEAKVEIRAQSAEIFEAMHSL